MNIKNPTIHTLVSWPIPHLVLLYALALMTSMSGMEIFGWSIVAAVLIFGFFNQILHFHPFKPFTLGVEIPLLGLIFITWLGLYLNAPQADMLFEMGRLRWIVLLYFLTYGISLFPVLNRVMTVLIWGSTIVAIYAIYQHFTGIDIIRWNHRAVTPAPFTGATVFQNTGFLSHHLTYGYSFSMLICFPFAALLLSQKRSTRARLFYLLAITLIGLSLVWTYGRGVWIATAAAFLIMTAYVSKKHLFSLLLIGSILFGILYTANPGIRERLNSIWSENNFSNNDRRAVWKANYEMFKDYPWLGVGYGQNEPRLREYYNKLEMNEDFGGHAHNNYLQMLSTTGLLGFVFYMLFILSFLMATSRLWSEIPSTHYWHRVIVLGALGAQISLHTGGMTQWNFGDAENTHVFIFILAMVAYLSDRYARGIVPDDYAL